MKLETAFSIFKRAMHVFKTNELLVSHKDASVIMTFNRPENLNAINKSILLQIQQTLREAENLKKLAIIKGNREKIFSCGGDIKILFNEMSISKKRKQILEFLKIEYRTIYMTKCFKLPYIALIDGLAMGAGLGLFIHGRYRIATENTVVAMPETRIGLLPDVSGTYFLPRLPRNFGVYMGLTGARVKGKSTVSAGIATHFVPQARLHELEMKLTQCTDEAEIESVLNHFQEPIDDCPIDDNIDHIERCFAAATVEEIIDRLKSLQNDWSRRILRYLAEAPPGCVKITLRALQRGAHMSLAECLQMELRVMLRCSKHTDCIIGIRTLLFEKDNKPKWNPATLAEVSESFVESHFEKLSPEHEMELEEIILDEALKM